MAIVVTVAIVITIAIINNGYCCNSSYRYNNSSARRPTHRPSGTAAGSDLDGV